MAAFTDSQAGRRAQQIFDQLGLSIHLACAHSGVSESFVAGFIGVESAFRGGEVVVDSRRFEPGVYDDLISLRDNGYCYVNGEKHSNYSGVRQSQIKDASEDAIRNLATSWGTTQIMGWHIINNLKCTIDDLRDPKKHLFYTIKLLKIVGGQYLRNGNLTAVLHIWNTGNANGKTYHEDYVVNALNVKKHYAQILANNPGTFTLEAEDAAQNGNGSDIPASMSDENGAGEQSGGEAAGGDASNAGKQVAENITNVNNGDKSVPDNFKPEDKTVNAPPPSGMMAKGAAWLTGLGLGLPSFSALVETGKNYFADGSVNLHDVFGVAGAVGKFVLPYAIYVGLAFIIFWGFKELLKQISLIVNIWVSGRADMHNVEVKPFAYEPYLWMKAPVKSEPEQPPSVTINDK